MKAVTVIKTVEEITGYEAIDGARFRTAEECSKYEESAKLVAYGKIKQYIVGETTAYNFYDGNGCDEDGIDIINIKDVDVLNAVNQYRVLCDKSVNLIDDSYIGKTIIIGWDYDRIWSWNMGTIDDVCNKIRKVYEGVIKKDDPKEE